MKFTVALLALLCVLSLSISVVAVVAQPVLLQDVKQGGTLVGYFQKTKPVLFWDFKRAGAKYNATTRALDVNTNAAEFNPDLGLVQAQTGVQVGTLTAKPTCNAARRGTYYTEFVSTDAADLTYQCCHSGTSYAWTAGYCQ